tara:strand:+ start:405 stop:770 length:366 start_codon:yes stop_codon:yes gene_type:complete
MKLLLENWREYLNENVFHVRLEELVPTEELGHGKDHSCPSEECEQQIQNKMYQIENGSFEPISVCNEKPIVTAKLQGQQDYEPAVKSGQSEPFWYVIDGHHRLEAAKRLGIEEVPVQRVQK